MLAFWKKSGNSNNSTKTQPTTSLTNHQKNNKSKSECIVSSKGALNFNPAPVLDDEGLFDIDEFESVKERSKLSKTILEVLSDKSALQYFAQFMESRNALQYVNCWLDVESFKCDVETFKKEKDLFNEPEAPIKIEHDSLSLTTDSDSLKTDMSSPCDSLNFDERSPSELITSDISPKFQHSLNNNYCDKQQRNVQKFIDKAIELFKKYIALEAGACNIKCGEDLRKELIENLCQSERVMSGNCFLNVQNYVLSVMENEYFEAFLGSDHYCKHQIDVLTSGNVALDDILYNETALFYFMEFLEQENNRSLLDFWIAATNFQQQLHVQKEFYDPTDAQNDAVVLYDKFFSLQAHCPLGFSDKVRFSVEQNICGESGLTIDCFHLPIKLTEQVLEKNYLKTFLSSQLFYKYLSELINTVQANGYSTNIERRNSPSDCSSEKSFSTNSTFLAMEMSVNNNVVVKKRGDMSIDTRELYDPDSLWKRKRNHRLSCGRITELGKYETDFEPEPDRKEFNLKKVVKKFVSLDEEEKKKEEMAWQVAEMIVKDITSVTLSDEKENL